MRLLIKCLKTFLLLYVHLLLNKPIKKFCFYTHLVNIPPHLHSQTKNWSNGWLPCYKRKGLLRVNSINLTVRLGHKYGLILHYVLVCCLLHLEDPSQTHYWFIWWSWDLFPNAFCCNGFVFLHPCINPYRFLYFFLKIGWLNLYKLIHKSQVAIVPLNWPPLLMKVWRISHILPCILHKSINFLSSFSPFSRGFALANVSTLWSIIFGCSTTSWGSYFGAKISSFSGI